MREDFVRMAKCRMCGKPSGSILIHKRLRSIPDEHAWDMEPCEACKERLVSMVHFTGECGHSGFVRDVVIRDRVHPPELGAAILRKRQVRMAKCFVCIDGLDVGEFETV